MHSSDDEVRGVGEKGEDRSLGSDHAENHRIVKAEGRDRSQNEGGQPWGFSIEILLVLSQSPDQNDGAAEHPDCGERPGIGAIFGTLQHRGEGQVHQTGYPKNEGDQPEQLVDALLS